MDTVLCFEAVSLDMITTWSYSPIVVDNLNELYELSLAWHLNYSQSYSASLKNYPLILLNSD